MSAFGRSVAAHVRALTEGGEQHWDEGGNEWEEELEQAGEANRRRKVAQRREDERQAMLQVREGEGGGGGGAALTPREARDQR